MNVEERKDATPQKWAESCQGKPQGQACEVVPAPSGLQPND